jgi:hypothetical protein
MNRVIIALVAGASLGILGCSSSSDPAVATVPGPGDPRALDEGVPCGDPLKVPFRFPNGAEVGAFTICNDEVYLTLEFGVDEKWLMAETQAVLLGPMKDPDAQRPALGRHQRVPLGEAHQPPVPHYAYWVNLEEMGWSAGDTLHFGARAAVRKAGEAGRPIRDRWAWAGEPGFAGSVRRSDSIYVIQPCEGGGGE